MEKAKSIYINLVKWHIRCLTLPYIRLHHPLSFRLLLLLLLLFDQCVRKRKSSFTHLFWAGVISHISFFNFIFACDFFNCVGSVGLMLFFSIYMNFLSSAGEWDSFLCWASNSFLFFPFYLSVNCLIQFLGSMRAWAQFFHIFFFFSQFTFKPQKENNKKNEEKSHLSDVVTDTESFCRNNRP